MRKLFSVLSLLLAGLLAVVSLSGYQVNQLLRSEEPVRYIAGELPYQEEFSDAVSEMMISELAQRLPEEISQYLGESVEDWVSGLVSGILDNERTRAAWDETLQVTREDYTGQLERLFHRGPSGDGDDLALSVDLSPVADATTQPVREALDEHLSFLPFVDAGSFTFLSPEIVVDVEAAAEDGADPYTWATVAGLSQYWFGFALAAGALLVLGLLLGPGRWRWIGLALGAGLAAALGAWMALNAASPSFDELEGAPEAARLLVTHVETRITEWAQPSWWVFTTAAGFATLLGAVGALVAPTARRREGV
ncbi:hypothetical protein [Nesterenkonia flava]|uniref:Uncharacterized protein n=1 Tax=Nesterenkonia flava TaxID=469799 RepID=A0ABU1FRA8_9MICC|nr:hypothetical protein [Nesterenkonia flava]MDR5710718.1 hypothetical protein [Nesterenkonia flava]